MERARALDRGSREVAKGDIDRGAAGFLAESRNHGSGEVDAVDFDPSEGDTADAGAEFERVAVVG